MTQKIKNIKNVITTKRNNRGLFFLLTIFALVGMMTLFSGQTLAQTACTPITTVTEGDLFPGGTISFGVLSGSGSVTVDHINAGTGMQSLTFVSSANNNEVRVLPAFVPGTFDPKTVTFTRVDDFTDVDFTLRAASTFHAIFIRVRCLAETPPPPTPTPMGCTYTQGYWKNHAEVWAGQNVTLGTVTYDQTQLLRIFRKPVQGNGLISLSYQLIAAKLNMMNGASVPMNVAMAILDADMLIGGQVVPPIGSNSLPTSTTSSLGAILDQYNNGNTPGGPRHCN